MEDTINILSAPQRGELLSALFRFARQERECLGSGSTDIKGHPALDAVTYMAFLPIAQTIRRDTEKWQQKRERYQQAALNRSGSQKKDEDCSWMRPYVQQREEADQDADAWKYV